MRQLLNQLIVAIVLLIGLSAFSHTQTVGSCTPSSTVSCVPLFSSTGITYASLTLVGGACAAPTTGVLFYAVTAGTTAAPTSCLPVVAMSTGGTTIALNYVPQFNLNQSFVAQTGFFQIDGQDWCDGCTCTPEIDGITRANQFYLSFECSTEQ